MCGGQPVRRQWKWFHLSRFFAARFLVLESTFKKDRDQYFSVTALAPGAVQSEVQAKLGAKDR